MHKLSCWYFVDALQAEFCRAGQCSAVLETVGQAAVSFMVFPRESSMMSSRRSSTVKTPFPGVTAEPRIKAFYSPDILPNALHRGVFCWHPHFILNHDKPKHSRASGDDNLRLLRRFRLVSTFIYKMRLVKIEQGLY